MREGPGKLLISFCLIISGFILHGQEIKVSGGFVQDSLMIGEDVDFWMTASYPPALEMMLPDTNYDFNPFEFSAKKYFETELRDGQAFDSAVYTLQSYEIDLIQYLMLNAFILNEQDSVRLSSNIDSIYFSALAPVVTDTTSLKTNLAYQSVSRAFNYPLMYYVIGGFVALFLIVLLIFGKRIVKAIKLRKLRKEYEKFSDLLTDYIRKLKNQPEPITAENALSLWKKYQSKLDDEPFTSYTTKDILALEFAKELEKPLKSIDRLIYSKKPDESIYQDFQQIEDFTQHRYSKKVLEIQEGK